MSYKNPTYHKFEGYDKNDKKPYQTTVEICKVCGCPKETWCHTDVVAELPEEIEDTL